MRGFDWGHRIAHVLGGIVEGFIILLAVAVIAGVIFLLVRYLLVATRAAQLYVDQHEPRRDAPLMGPPPVDPLSPTSTASTTAPASATSTTVPSTAATTPMPAAEEPTKPVTRPATKRAPKTPPAE